MNVKRGGNCPDGEYDPPIESLVVEARSGDRQALEAILDRLYPTMLRFLVQLTRDMELARDLTQDTLMSVSRGVQRLDQADAFMPWVYRIARNTFYSAHRKQKLRGWLSLDWLVVQQSGDPLLDPASPIEQWVEGEVIEHVLADLTPIAREILYLRHIAGYSGVEIALILEISLSATKQRIHRAERDFRHRYAELHGETAHSVARSGAR